MCEHRIRVWALLVGTEAYDDPAIRPLRYAVNDVTDCARVLRLIWGESVSACVVLSDLENDGLVPRRDNVLRELENLAEAASPEDLVVILLVGHGTTRDGRFYFLPRDSVVTGIEQTAVSLGDLGKYLRRVRSRRKLLLLDACHSGSTLGTSHTAGGPDALDELRDLGTGWGILASCRGDEVSIELEDEKHGAFTYFVLRYLTAGDFEGRRTVSGLVAYVSRELEQRLFQTGLPDQSPILLSSPTEEIRLEPPSRRPEEASDRHDDFFRTWVLETFRGPRGSKPAHFGKLVVGSALLLAAILCAESLCVLRINQPPQLAGLWAVAAFPSMALIVFSWWVSVTAGTAGIRVGRHSAGYIGTISLAVGCTLVGTWWTSTVVLAGGDANLLFCLGLLKDLLIVGGVVIALGLNPLYVALNLTWLFQEANLTSVREALRAVDKLSFYESSFRIAAASVPFRLYVLGAAVAAGLIYVHEIIWLSTGATGEALGVVLIRDCLVVALCVFFLAWYQAALCALRRQLFPPA